MKTYRLYISWEVGQFMEVTAETEEEAHDLVFDRFDNFTFNQKASYVDGSLQIETHAEDEDPEPVEVQANG